VKSSLQRELDSFYKEVTGSEFNIRQVTKGAFSQARAKLKPDAFIELNRSVVETFYEEAPWLAWCGFRLLAVDGSRLMLPNHPSIIEEFGQHNFGPNADSPRSLGLCSMLYDPLNLLTVDARLAPYSSSERDLLYQHLSQVKEGDLLLFDRGYPSIALLFLLTAKRIQFCVRMKEDWWLSVKKFKESGKKDQIVELALPAKDKKLLKDYPDFIDDTIGCRLVRVDLPGGETEILCTSLVDPSFTCADIQELYHLRWCEEEGYKLLKSRIEVENFSGKTSIAVKQDFYAKIYMMSLCACLAFPIEEKVQKEYKEDQNKHPQKINRTNAYAMLQNISIGMLLGRTVRLALHAYDNIVYTTREIIRPGRQIERKKRPKKFHYMNYKRL
jgi:Transposase DDE domain